MEDNDKDENYKPFDEVEEKYNDKYFKDVAPSGGCLIALLQIPFLLLKKIL